MRCGKCESGEQKREEEYDGPHLPIALIRDVLPTAAWFGAALDYPYSSQPRCHQARPRAAASLSNRHALGRFDREGVAALAPAFANNQVGMADSNARADFGWRTPAMTDADEKLALANSRDLADRNGLQRRMSTSPRSRRSARGLVVMIRPPITGGAPLERRFEP